ncbi:hypothetical protein KR51_00009620 [Rubidibacter lacunae KORDI 51-2]|uniref:Putative nickel insertion protein n=1 Tax=Rubidibacter lacunae KORDI 51-2 TaxID=582515 RepID=U5DL12_9CHRO|nr:nickel pincer cofactor biosynthesis protein LarC [Rubidibacter lacunae]ERN42371.1 hypothetical protein KR51_00009620 [Rubidibacter lacunae KORDI 51-2]
MATIAYLDCPTGIAGDMCLGALVDAGVPLDYLRDRLSTLGIANEFALRAETVTRGSQQAKKVHVDCARDLANSDCSHLHHHQAPTRHLPEIEQLIQKAELPPRAAMWSLEVFRKLALAEGAVHGVPPERVHFHEVGAVDAIVDIVGTCLGLDWLDLDALFCSPLPTGGGTVKSAHGRMTVPVPAVLKLWEQRQVPVYGNGIDRELVTPTGAAIVTALVREFGPLPPLRVRYVGLGAGTAELSLPNVLRLWVGTNDEDEGSIALETVAVLETQIDDLSPQAIAYACEQLLTAGALDVFAQAVTMKKSRPGVLLTVICLPALVEKCEFILYRETTTLGIRRRIQQRSCLARELKKITTPLGPVRVKVAHMGKDIANVQPEYDDCARLAREHDCPWNEVHQLAIAAWTRHAEWVPD